MRDETALTAFHNSSLDAYPKYWANWFRVSGITERQFRMSVRVLIRREQNGDLSATAALDQMEAEARDFKGWVATEHERHAAA